MSKLYPILTLATAISGFAIGIFALAKQPKKKLVRIWFVLCLMIGGWNLGYYITMLGGVLKEHALLASKISHACGILIAALFFHFVLEFLKLDRLKKRILWLAYISCGIVSILSLTSFVVIGLTPKLFMKYYPVGRLGYGVYIFFFLGWVVYAHKLMIQAYKQVTPHIRNQLKYFLTGTVLGFYGGANCFPLIFGYPWLPYASTLILIFPFTTTYAMFKYRLMEIELVIKKTLIFAGVFAFIFAVFAGVTFFTQEFLVALLGDNTRYAIFLFSVFLITLGIRPLEHFLINLTDNILFQRKYDYQKTLKEASEGMALITDMKKLLSLIARIVSKSIRIKSAAIFQLDEEKNKYVLRIRRGSVRRHSGYSLDKDDALVGWFREHKEALLYDEIEDWLRSGRFLRKEKGLRDRLIEIKEEMADLGGAICVPSFYKACLIGFLVLGEKLSGDIYTEQDIHLLSTLASEAAIAVENAKNFMEVEKLREKERESYIQTVLALAQTVDEKDSYTRGHLEDVNYYGMRVADELLESSEFNAVINKEDLDTSLHLHDIGKIGVPDAILHKNGKLTASEWEIMKQHCEIGARIVEPIAKLRNVGNIIKHHQEKYDGTGYPDGLKGEEIPLEARIISVVDAYHVMVSDRPYRKALPEGVALAELKKNIGTQFDPIVVAAFVRAWEKGNIKKI